MCLSGYPKAVTCSNFNTDRLRRKSMSERLAPELPVKHAIVDRFADMFRLYLRTAV